MAVDILVLAVLVDTVIQSRFGVLVALLEAGRINTIVRFKITCLGRP